MREKTEPGVLVAETRTESQPRARGGQGDADAQLVRETVPVHVPPANAPLDRIGHAPAVDAPGRPWGSLVRIAFGAIWLVDAYFKWQPSFLTGLSGVIHDGAAGQPGWLLPWFTLVRAIVVVQPTAWAYAVAVVETGIALALVFGFARKLTYVGGALWSLAIWTTAEGFGRVGPGEIATDIGTAIVYAVAFLALLVADRCWMTRPWSIDATIERRLSWWSRIAEVRQ